MDSEHEIPTDTDETQAGEAADETDTNETETNGPDTNEPETATRDSAETDLRALVASSRPPPPPVREGDLDVALSVAGPLALFGGPITMAANLRRISSPVAHGWLAPLAGAGVLVAATLAILVLPEAATSAAESDAALAPAVPALVPVVVDEPDAGPVEEPEPVAVEPEPFVRARRERARAPVASTSAPSPEAPVPAPEPREVRGSTPSATLGGAPSWFEVRRAAEAVEPSVGACVPDGEGSARVTFVVAGHSGRVEDVIVPAPYAGTPAGTCMRRALARFVVAPFEETTFSITYPFAL